MDRRNASSDSVSDESCNLGASWNEHGHSYNKGQGQRSNSYTNRGKGFPQTDRNDRQIHLSPLGIITLEQSESCNTVPNFEDDFPPLSIGCSRSKVTNTDIKGNRDALGLERSWGVSSFKGDTFVSPSDSNLQVLPSQFGKRQRQIYVKKSSNRQKLCKSSAGTNDSDFSSPSTEVERLNICRLPLFNNMNARDAALDSMEQVQIIEAEKNEAEVTSRVLRSGMVLLKSYISLHEQVEIVKTCDQLGEGPGGFYRPGYQDGAKLRLYMMCLGLNWVPQTGEYTKQHPIDNCVAPGIPREFGLLVQRAIQDARALIEKSEEGNVEHTLPTMSPDICIANFYRNTGRLGLHQDRDESLLSRRKGLPVVSFSIGDSAVFLFGDDRDPDKAEEVILESGDVLLFGGKSRMIFHGVSSIIPDSAPDELIKETGLLPGRLNLTFRQF